MAFLNVKDTTCIKICVYLLFYSGTLFCKEESSTNDVVCECPGNCLCLRLDGDWNIKCENSSKEIKVKGVVPGNVYSSLLANGVIKDPYFMENDSKYKWVAEFDWVYSRTFTVSKEILGRSKVDIIFDGLDTAAEIYINHKFVGSTRSMFVKYTYPIKRLLEIGKNTITVFFHSPIKYASEQSKKYLNKFGYMVPPESRPPDEHGDAHVNFIRKEPCSFGWDWGPSFPTVGIWKSVSIQAYDIAVLENILVHTKRVGSGWLLYLRLIVKSYKQQQDVKALIVIQQLNVTKTFPLQLEEEESVARFKVDLKDHSGIRVWMPRGFGKQSLYTLKVSLLDSKEKALSAKSIEFGFRTIELIQEKIPGSDGLSFYFKINSVPIFLKGSNWIPADAFKDNVTEDKVRNILQSAYDANMNVLRVWGGGIYEEDFFYSMTDKMGILIWHDFMFACAMYPSDEQFLGNVSMEIRHQVRRLQYHPSILLWSGNNENEVALRQGWYDTQIDFERFRKDYIKLYVKTVKPIVEKEDTSRPFIVSSPSNGKQSEEEGWIAGDPQSPMYGDVHFYDYGADCWDVNVFPKPRMSTEYGYQSYPSYETLRPIAHASDLEWSSSLMEYRQHFAGGNGQIEAMIKNHFDLPQKKNATFYFKGMIYLSQIMQALCIKYETENYRRMRGNLIARTGHTMGAMYWQLNDIWQAPSWSSLEYGGKWKMLHYYAKDFFEPVMASAYKDDSGITVYVISDLLKKIEDANLKISAFQWTSFTPKFSKEKKISILPASSTRVEHLASSEVCDDIAKCFVTVSLDVKDITTPSSPVFVTSPKDAVGMQNPKLKIKKSNRKQQNVFEVEVEAESPAAFVWLNTSVKGRFSDNGFLMTQATKTVKFYAWEVVSADTFSNSLTVTSLYDLYH